MNKQNTMKADVSNMRETEKNFSNARNGFDREIAVIDPATGRSIVIARFFWPASQVTCLLWVHGKTAYGRGIGRAGGYGYHKPSAALGAAIGKAGIVLSQAIDGRGDGLMTEACEAIARAVTGKRRFITHVAHA